MRFTEIDFAPEVLDGIESMGFEEMTPIQEQAVPAILDQRDMIACAQTGTGKTAAFMLPVLSQLVDYKGKGKIRAMVIVPTRELAIQIEQQVQGFSYFLDVSSVSVYGGNNAENWNTQKRALTTGVDIVVTTPGRLIQHLNLNYLDLTGMEFFILDEADRMLDMGFLDDIVKISKSMPKEKQTLMFSATMPRKIRDLAKQLLHDPVEITIQVSKPATGIDQRVYSVFDNQKLPVLQNIFKDEQLSSVIIFSSTKHKVKEITQTLKRKKVSVREIHSDLDQVEREETLRMFRNKQVKVLVATDILSRGIDIKEIDMVINYDVPPDPEDYVHRIGRTARAEAKGVAITFINKDDQHKFQRIEKMVDREYEFEQIPEELGEGPAYNRGYRNKHSNKKYKNRNFKPHNNKGGSKKPVSGNRNKPKVVLKKNQGNKGNSSAS